MNERPFNTDHRNDNLQIVNKQKQLSLFPSPFNLSSWLKPVIQYGPNTQNHRLETNRLFSFKGGRFETPVVFLNQEMRRWQEKINRGYRGTSILRNVRRLFFSEFVAAHCMLDRKTHKSNVVYSGL